MSAGGGTMVHGNVPIKAHRLTKELLRNEVRQLMHLEASKKLKQTWEL